MTAAGRRSSATAGADAGLTAAVAQPVGGRGGQDRRSPGAVDPGAAGTAPPLTAHRQVSGDGPISKPFSKGGVTLAPLGETITMDYLTEFDNQVL